MPVTRQQLWSQSAFSRVNQRATNLNENDLEKYLTFAKQLPSLIHTCGAVQAMAFGYAKGSRENGIMAVLKDVNDVHHGSGTRELQDLLMRTREDKVMPYLKLNRELITVSSWIKRYTEALLKAEDE